MGERFRVRYPAHVSAGIGIAATCVRAVIPNFKTAPLGAEDRELNDKIFEVSRSYRGGTVAKVILQKFEHAGEWGWGIYQVVKITYKIPEGGKVICFVPPARAAMLAGCHYWQDGQLMAP